MSVKPFVINAILGNSRLLVTLTADAEVQRLFWPNVDGPQHAERYLGGVSLNGGAVTWQDSPAWTHRQAYEADQNVLVTRSSLADGLVLTTTDAAVPAAAGGTPSPGRDLLVRHLTFANEGASPIGVRYLLYQWFRFDENPLYNTVLFDEQSEALVHFRRGAYLATGANRPVSDFEIGYPAAVWAHASAGALQGGAVLHGDVAGAAVWDLGVLAPGESTALSLYLVMGENLAAVSALLGEARAAGAAALLAETRDYWTGWLGRARPLAGVAGVAPGPVAGRRPYLPGIPDEPAAPEQVTALYRRSLLVFKLLSDEATGAVIAAPEFDPAFTACGGYAYCWGRDAAYITTAMDLAGYHDLAANFYRWAVRTQEPEGWWMHRHQASGQWGPSWGLLQVDETGSILFGMALHARLHGGEAFVRSVWESVTRAADWLVSHRDPETGLACEAVDLWEERTARLIYSSGAVFAGLKAAAEMGRLIGEAAAAARYEEAAADLRAAILREGVREGRFLRGRFLRVPAGVEPPAGVEAPAISARPEGPVIRMRPGAKGHPIYEATEDPVSDSSLLGMCVPFGVVEPADPVMSATAERLVADLWTAPAGGMKRYVGDHYRGGNPWILTTLWLGQYEAERGEEGKARQILDWAVARRNGVGLLAEQVDPVTGEPVWVVPLTWSHAMYVLLALRLYA